MNISFRPCTRSRDIYPTLPRIHVQPRPAEFHDSAIVVCCAVKFCNSTYDDIFHPRLSSWGAEGAKYGFRIEGRNKGRSEIENVI